MFLPDSDSWPPPGFQFLWDEREAVALRPVIFHPVCRACAQTSPNSTLTSIYSLCCPGYSAQSVDHVPCWRRKRPLNGSAAFALLSFNRIFSRPRLSLPVMLLPQAVRVLWEPWGPPLSVRGLISGSCHFLRRFAPPASPPRSVSSPSFLCVCRFIRKHHHRASLASAQTVMNHA